MKFTKAINAIFAVILLFATFAVAGDWDNAQHATVLNGKLYTIEVGGALFMTELPGGARRQLGKADFANTKFLFATTSKLITIESDGNLYSIDPTSGSWRSVGKSGEWSRTQVGATIGETLYTVEREGQMYETNTTTGVWRQIGQTKFLRTKFLYSDGVKLYAIENDGYFYSINPSSGASQKIGNSNDWLNTNRSVMFAGKLYSTEGGALYETDPSTGAWKKISKEYIRADHLFGSGSSLYYIEFNGELYRINLADGSVVQIGK